MYAWKGRWAGVHAAGGGGLPQVGYWCGFLLTGLRVSCSSARAMLLCASAMTALLHHVNGNELARAREVLSTPESTRVAARCAGVCTTGHGREHNARLLQLWNNAGKGKVFAAAVAAFGRCCCTEAEAEAGELQAARQQQQQLPACWWHARRRAGAHASACTCCALDAFYRRTQMGRMGGFGALEHGMAVLHAA